jgi:Protein kinase domain
LVSDEVTLVAELESRERPPETPPPSIDVQLVDELWARARTSLPAFLVVVLVAWPLVRGPASESRAILLGYVTTVAIALSRLVAALVLARRPALLPARSRYALMLGTALASGATLALLDALLYERLGPLDLGLWIMFIAGIAGGATISMGARPEVFLAYAAPPLAAFVVAFAIRPRAGTAIVPVAVGIWLVYSFAQVIQYGRSRRQFLQLNVDLEANMRRVRAVNEELARKNTELVEMSRRADRIFAALGDALPGRVLAGKYTLVSRIGAGGFAIVFRGTHTGLGRQVAVKIFRPQAGNDSAAALERFRYEGMVNSRVRHPNIVDVLDAGVADDGIPYIAMELLDGHTLEAELEEGKALPLRRVAPIVEQVCRGLAAAHAAGVVHRDVKPENVFLHHERGEEIVKVLDFGIAKVTDELRLARAELTSTGELVGSPRYMAPERLLGLSCDASADVYGVGVILFRALAGRAPFEGGVYEIMTKVLSQRPPDVRTLVPGLPVEVAESIMQALSEKGSDRPSAGDLADVLRRAVRSFEPAEMRA